MLSFEQYQEKLKSIRLVSLDVDGTLTDGKLYYLPGGQEARVYNVKDGIGILLMQAAGVKTALMTTGTIDPIALRGYNLKMDYVETGIHQKDQRLQEICDELNISMDEVCHIGDDINDVPAFKAVGLAVLVGDATAGIAHTADYQLQANGGMGAIREFAEDLLAVQNVPADWDLLQEYFKQQKQQQQNG